ncbi:MAG: hypothetical protein LBT14_11535 [Treponema sp.]|nr:hypothetical protein [Treponema sp.]
MSYEIVVADPAKNITILVLNAVENRGEAAKVLLADPSWGAEQVGFVVPPKDPAGIWRLEMMGGEFCGNAARSFGLFVARLQGLSGNQTVTIGISGMPEPLSVAVDLEQGAAAVEIPKPVAQDTLDFDGQSLPVYRFDGITQVIAPDMPPGKDVFYGIKRKFEAGQTAPDALGVMFYDKASRLMTPAVYVYGTDSLVFESSCGSGSAALAAWETRDGYEGEYHCPVAQPGGIIAVRVRKQTGKITDITIGGPVTLSERRYVWD